MSNWSKYQEAIFAWPDDPNHGHLMIRASAGAGKTTSLCELYRRITTAQPNARCQFLAFNKKIADELQRRGVPAGTMNSFGFKAVLRAMPRARLDGNKTRVLCKAMNLPYGKQGMYVRAVSLMKSYLFDWQDTDQVKVQDLCTEFALSETPLNGVQIAQIIKLFQQSIAETNTIDFDDQICFPYYHELEVPKFDYVFGDEVQDFSPNKLELVARAVGSHFVGVGDPFQSIYTFAGADSSSMDKIAARFNPLVLTLPVTYRCGKSIVAETHRLKVAPAEFQAGPENIEGEVRDVEEMQFVREVKPTDFVLCRNNAPLVSCCFNLIKRGIRSMIVGRDIGAKLATLADKINERAPTSPHKNEIVEFVEKMQKYQELEVKKLYAAMKEDQAETLADQIDCLNVFVENSQTFAAMKQKIADMFDDSINPAAVVFSSIHKAKGLEADVVWALPGRGGKGRNAKQEQEERNLIYVMITRAKRQFNRVKEAKK